jgi:hypothetical protein
MPNGTADSLDTLHIANSTPLIAVQKEPEPISLFQYHLLQPKHKELRQQPHADSHQGWIATILLVCFGLFAWTKGARASRLSQIFNAILINSSINRAFRAEYASGSGTSIILSTIYLSVYSLFIFQLLGFKSIFLGSLHPFLLFLLIISMVFSVYVFKILVIRASGNIFKATASSNEYIFNFFIHNQALGLLLMPVVIFGAFSKDVPLNITIYCGIILIFSMYIYRIIKSFLQALSISGISLFYLFLYLCAIEVVPSVFIAKVILNNMVRQ